MQALSRQSVFREFWTAPPSRDSLSGESVAALCSGNCAHHRNRTKSAATHSPDKESREGGAVQIVGSELKLIHYGSR